MQSTHDVEWLMGYVLSRFLRKRQQILWGSCLPFTARRHPVSTSKSLVEIANAISHDGTASGPLQHALACEMTLSTVARTWWIHNMGLCAIKRSFTDMALRTPESILGEYFEGENWGTVCRFWVDENKSWTNWRLPALILTKQVQNFSINTVFTCPIYL